MFRNACLALTLALALAGCDNDTSPSPSSPSGPSAPTAPRFTATLSPANEVPPVSNADASGSGVATITLNTTTDAGGNITAATADFQVTLSGFPANTTLTGAHIHTGTAGSIGGILVSTTLANGEVVLADGSGSFSKSTISVGGTDAQAIIANPTGYYFNVHTTTNPGGAVRGQLVRSN